MKEPGWGGVPGSIHVAQKSVNLTVSVRVSLFAVGEEKKEQEEVLPLHSQSHNDWWGPFKVKEVDHIVLD